MLLGTSNFVLNKGCPKGGRGGIRRLGKIHKKSRSFFWGPPLVTFFHLLCRTSRNVWCCLPQPSPLKGSFLCNVQVASSLKFEHSVSTVLSTPLPILLTSYGKKGVRPHLEILGNDTCNTRNTLNETALTLK